MNKGSGWFFGCIAIAIAAWAYFHKTNEANLTILPHYIFSFHDDPARFWVQGTWILEDDEIAWPAQTTTIECKKATGRCLEASAVLATNPDSLFPVTINEFEITHWDSDTIVMKGATAACISETYQVNLLAQMVTGLVTKSAGSDGGACGMTSGEPKRMRMIDGYKASMKRRHPYSK